MAIVHCDPSQSNGAFPQDARSAAEVYQRKGLVPIAMPPRSKDPGRDGWQHERYTLDTLDTHFPSQQLRNVAILNGVPSGNIVDADLDCEQALCLAERFLPPTGWIFGRPSASRSHRIYRTDQPLDIAQVAFEDVDGTMLLELRGSGGLTVFPPSLHKDTGELITWDRFEEAAQVVLDDLQRAAGELAAAVLLARHWPNQGTRDKAAMALTGALLRRGWTAEKTRQFVEAVAVAAGDEEARMRAAKAGPTAKKLAAGEEVTGWPTLGKWLGDKGVAIVSKVCEWLGDAPPKVEPWPDPVPLGEIPEAMPFPLDVLPTALQRVATETATAVGGPVDFAAVPTVVLGGASLGASRALAIKNKHVQPAIVYVAEIGAPGSGKTPEMEQVLEPLQEIEDELRVTWDEAMEAYQEQLDEYEADLKTWKSTKKADRGERPEKPERPILERLTANDATTEALATILKENPRGVAYVRDELIGWVRSMNQYREGGQGADQQFWLSAWSGVSTTTDRKGTHEQGPLRVRRPFMSVLGGLTPDKLPTLRGDKPRQRVEQDGFMDRLLLVYPDVADVVEETWQEGCGLSNARESWIFCSLTGAGGRKSRPRSLGERRRLSFNQW